MVHLFNGRLFHENDCLFRSIEQANPCFVLQKRKGKGWRAFWLEQSTQYLTTRVASWIDRLAVLCSPQRNCAMLYLKKKKRRKWRRKSWEFPLNFGILLCISRFL